MVESSQAKIHFTKLSLGELSNKIALLVSSENRVIFWKNPSRYYEGKALALDKKNNTIFLTLHKLDVPTKVANEIICLNFTLKEIDYFMRGKVVDQDEKDNLSLKIELEEDCFRVEKRRYERLRAYPGYDAYVYLKFNKIIKENIIYFNKHEQKSRDLFSVIDSLEKEKLLSVSKGLQLLENEDLAGFRVEDLSEFGLSFFVNAKEKEVMIDVINGKHFPLVLTVNTKIFNIDQATIVYKMDYINNQFAGIPMFKIGASFKQNSKLKETIKEIAGHSLETVDYQKEFSEFIKNE